MGEGSDEEDRPALPSPPPHLFERLAQLPGYTWETSLHPFHSTYDNWHVFGLWHLNQEASAASSPRGTSGRTNSTKSSPRLGPQRPGIRHHEATSYTERGTSINENTSVTSKSEANMETRTYTPVIARISTHALRIEREYYLCKSFMQTSDPDCNHVARLIDLVRLPSRAGDGETLTASIFESPGRNYLKEFLDFGPAWLGPAQWFRETGSSNLPSEGQNPPQVSLATFLDFAIGASECLELLHHGIRVVHGELRADAFHFNRETGLVRLINFGSGPRSFENGLTSSGWLALSQELGIKHKLQYIAPEQTGRMPAEPDSRTDIYSLGVIFWTMLTGRPAFEGETPIDVIQAVLGKRLPSISSFRMDVPDAVSNLVRKMTQKQIEERYHSTSGLKHDLVEIRRLLGEGDAEELQSYIVGTKDVSSFFVLPTKIFGRKEEHAKIIEIAKGLAKAQQSYQETLSNGLGAFGSTSASTISDRLDQLELGTRSSGRSSMSSQAGRGSPPASPRLDARRLPTVVRQDTQSDEANVVNGRPSLEPTNTRDTIETLTTTNSSRLAHSRNDQSSSKRPGSGRGANVARSAKPRRRRRRCEVINVIGKAGSGKSSLLQSTQAEIRELGYFTAAKFDAAKKVPFEPLLHAMGSLLRQIFSESDLDTPYHNLVRAHLRGIWAFVSAMLDLPENLLHTESTSKKGNTLSVSTVPHRSLQNDIAETASMYSFQSSGPLVSASEFSHGGTNTRSMKFISVFTDVMRILSTNRLVCLCLDGIHHADPESLELVSNIIMKKLGILIVTTCRDEKDLSPAVHKIMHSEEARSATIRLSPLSEQQVIDYVAVTLQRPQEYVLPLAIVCLEKSDGNPFYLRQMLELCHRKSCLWYSWKQSQWEFDLDRVFAEFSSEGAEDQQLNSSFITKRLQKDLSPCSRAVLAWASLLGSTFSFAMIQKLLSGEFDDIDGFTGYYDSRCTGRSEVWSHKSSANAVEGLQTALQSYVLMPGCSEDEFCFSHDRYLHAAVALRECQNVEKMHFMIVQTMMKYPDLDGRSVYARAQHICEAINLIKRCVHHRRPYRLLLLEAAKKAIQSGARPSALQYYETILELLQPNAWNDAPNQDTSYDETLAMYTEAAALYWHQGHFVDAQTAIDTIFAHARMAAHKAPAWILQSKLFAHGGNMSDSFTALKTSLIELGLKFASQPTWEACDEEFHCLRENLDAEDFKGLLEKPLSTNPNVIAIGSVLVEAISSAFWSDSLLFYQMALQMMEMHVTSSGIFQQTGLGCMYFAMACIIRNADTQFAVRMHTRAMKLLMQYESSYTLGRGLGISGLFIAHLFSPLREHAYILEEAVDHALISGDKHLFLLAVGGIAMARIFVGDDAAEIESYCAVAPEDFTGDWTKDVRGGTFLMATRQVARALQGKTWTEYPDKVMSDEHHLTTDYMSWVSANASNDDIPRIAYQSLMIIPLFLYGHHDKVIEVGNELIPILGSLWSSRNSRLVLFYAALSIIANVRQNPDDPERRDVLLATVERYNEQIVAWQVHCDANYLMWSCLIEAELNEVRQHYHTAIQRYESAIDHCQLYDFHLELALAFELQGEFFIRRGAKRAARATIQDSMAIWSRMNARGKVEQLSAKHEWILRSSTTVRTSDTGCQTTDTISEIGNTQSRLEENDRQERRHLGPETAGDRTNAWLTPNVKAAEQSGMTNPATHKDMSNLGLDILDLQSILEFNQAISSELQIDRLLAKMTEIILESVGAQADFAAIVIEGEHGWCIAASGTGDGISIEPQPIADIEDETQKQVLLYTLRFNELVFVHNLALDDRFSKSKSQQSALCLPILQGKDLLGVLYLQGQPHSFTDRSLAVLQLFCNQVSISITNALLFRKIAKVSAANASMIESQKLALAKAREAEIKAKAAEAEAMENVRLKEEAAKAKSMFLANVSHELRTPLNGVIGMSELLKGSTLSKEQEGFADSIRVCADTLLTVINDILDFSKLEAGKMKLLRVPLNLKDTIAEVVRALSYTNAERGLQTHAELDLNPDQLVMGDPVRIHQIFMNLLSNSYKFTAKGSVTVRAKVNDEDKQSIRVTCSVADTGIGVTQEQVTRLFKPFSQADSSTQRSYGGSGLGLSICKALVAVLGGKIWLESQLGQGTTVFFTLSFPKTTSQAVSNANGAATSKPDLMATWSSDESQAGYPTTVSYFDLSLIPRAEFRICIAEDNPINQKIAVSFVTKLGFKCEAYSDGLQAVEALRAASAHKNPFHLCLMDVQMPVLDGYDATRLIRKDEDPVVRGTVIVAMTASAIRGDREKCLQAGMNNYLAKPVRIAVLKSMLEDIVSQPTKPLPAPDQTATALVRDAMEESKKRDDANDVALGRPGFEKRMGSRNDIRTSGKAGTVSLARENSEPEADNANGNGNGNNTDKNKLRPSLVTVATVATVPTVANSKEDGHEKQRNGKTIKLNTKSSDDEKDKTQTAVEEGAKAPDEAVPPISLV